LDGADAAGGAGQNHVARQQRQVRGDEADEFGGPIVVKAQEATINSISAGTRDSTLVTLEGIVRGQNSLGAHNALALEWADRTLQVLVSTNIELPTVVAGTRLRVTGVCQIDQIPYAELGLRVGAVRILPRSADDFVVLARPPRWTIRRALTAMSAVEKSERRIRSITLDKAPVDSHGAPSPQPLEKNFLTVEAAMFIDCSYEGDLLAGAGVSHRTDREGRDEFNESFAGVSFAEISTERAGNSKAAQIPLRIDPFVRPGGPSSGLLPFVSASPLPAEGQKNPAVQSCSFRLCLTKQDSIPIAPPANYDPLNYEIVRRYLAALDAVREPLLPGDLYFNFGSKLPYPHPRLLKITKLMRGKTDVNSGSCGISMDFVNGGAERYANGSWTERAKIWRAHEDYQRGYFYFLRTDARLPEWLRKEISPWGLPKDEFRDTGGWPTQLYIRAARRMVGQFVINQNFCEHPVVREDSVGLGSYSLDSHVCQRLVKDGAVIHEGGFYHRLEKPYPIPFTAIVPREGECENLLVTFCVSATHVAFASVRMEPPFMILSESAALAADQALREGTSIQKINQTKLRTRLQDAGQIL
jgi:hypothetical protein